MDFSKILDFFKQPRLVFGVALSSGLVLFLPSPVLQKLGLVGLRDVFSAYIGIAFIVTAVYCLIYVSNLVLDWLIEKKKEREVKYLRQEYLAKLTEEEQEILRYFVSYSTKTQRLDIHSGVVHGLVKKNIIFRASSKATTAYMDNSWYGPAYTCDHNLTTWAWDYLNEHRELLGIV